MVVGLVGPPLVPGICGRLLAGSGCLDATSVEVLILRAWCDVDAGAVAALLSRCLADGEGGYEGDGGRRWKGGGG